MPRHAQAVAFFLRLFLLSLPLHLSAPAFADSAGGAGAAAPAGPALLYRQGRWDCLAGGVCEEAPTQTRGCFQEGTDFSRPTGCCRVTTISIKRVHDWRVNKRKRVQD
jgi:hypothetical protein